MKVYKSKSKRFVKIQNAIGMYLQKDKTFQKERNSDSIGICVLQTPNSRKVALFDTFRGTWEECKKFCTNCGGYMPNMSELIIARQYIDLKSWHWTCEEYSQDNAWTLYLNEDYFGRIYSVFKCNDRSVIAFMEIPV